MKKLFSKKSGFTLVEIVVAFAVFAIMAAMILQVIHLTINRQNSNREYEKEVAAQEEKLIAQGINTDYDSSKKETGQLEINFDATSEPMKLDYNVKNADGEYGKTDGINYIIGGDINYNANGGYLLDSDDSDNPSLSDIRIKGRPGIQKIKIQVSSTGVANQYNITVNVDEGSPASGGVPLIDKINSQITLYFGKPVATNSDYGSRVQVEDISYSSTKYRVQKTPDKCGVNIHAETTDGLSSTTISFKVKLASDIPGFSKESFGENGSNGTYTPYKRTETHGGETKEVIYESIFGLYFKPDDTSTPTT